MNLPLVLADLLVVVHFLFIVFVVLGGLLGLVRPWLLLLHLPAAAWGAAVVFSGMYCPLTPLEQRLRAAGGRESYETGFIEHYLVPVIYPAGLTREVQWLLGVAVVAINAVIYGYLFARNRRLAGRAPQSVTEPEK
jgi:hypothetical protein